MKILKNYSFIILLVIGLFISATCVYAATSYIIESENVLYDNTTSGGSSSTVQGALDELYEKAGS